MNRTLIRFKRVLIQSKGLYQCLIFVGIYALWVILVRLLSLTWITYFTISPTSRFQDINDAFSSNEVSLMGLSAALFIFLLYQLNPISLLQRSDLINRKGIEKYFLPGFIQGASLIGALILIFVLTDIYHYWGYFIQLDEAPLELANVILRMIALGSLAYCEEFIFRNKLAEKLRDSVPYWISAQLIAFLYCGIKILQFDLSWLHVLTLYLVSLALSLRAEKEGQFYTGAGIWTAVLIITHPLLSLPIFGNTFSGILLVKYHSSPSDWARLLAGGVGGPLSSFGFQLILILDIVRNVIDRKVHRYAISSTSNANRHS